MGDMDLYYVYKLFYPDGFIDEDGTDLSGVVFYVGKGTKILGTFSQRVDSHELDAKAGQLGRKSDVIRMILARGMFVGKAKIYETSGQEDALHREMEFINEYKTPYLTNIRTRLRRKDECKNRRYEPEIREINAVSDFSHPESALSAHPVFILTDDVLDCILSDRLPTVVRARMPDGTEISIPWE